MSANRQNKPEIFRSEQAVQNWSFDEEYKVSVAEGLGFDGSSSLKRAEADDQQMKIVEDGGYTYICKSAVGTPVASALWKIFRIDSSGNKMYADGDADYDNVATDPTALTYSYS